MTKNPQDKLFATASSGINKYASVEAGNIMKSDAVTMEGGSQPHENMPPWIALRFIICLNGYYPVRP
jgi:microcystin-dependent protein